MNNVTRTMFVAFAVSVPGPAETNLRHERTECGVSSTASSLATLDLLLRPVARSPSPDQRPRSRFRPHPALTGSVGASPSSCSLALWRASAQLVLTAGAGAARQRSIRSVRDLHHADLVCSCRGSLRSTQDHRLNVPQPASANIFTAIRDPPNYNHCLRRHRRRNFGWGT